MSQQKRKEPQPDKTPKSFGNKKARKYGSDRVAKTATNKAKNIKKNKAQGDPLAGVSRPGREGKR